MRTYQNRPSRFMSFIVLSLVLLPLQSCIDDRQLVIQYQLGYTEGERIGYEKGLLIGRKEGSETATFRARQEGLDAGYTKGFRYGYEKGKEDAYTAGLEKGYAAGLQEGLQQGYGKGFSYGKELGIKEGVQIGLSRGGAKKAHLQLLIKLFSLIAVSLGTLTGTIYLLVNRKRSQFV